VSTKAVLWFYVCDTCSAVAQHEGQIPEDSDWNCPVCDGSAAWEFPPDRRRAALDHAAHIQRIVDSGLFRKVRP